MARTRTNPGTGINYPYYWTWVRDPKYIYPYEQKYVQRRFESITDTNNRRSRPESGVSHTKCTYIEQPFPTHKFWAGGYEYFITNKCENISAASTHNCLQYQLGERIREVQAQLNRRWYDEYARVAERFSAINFLAELRSLPDLFKSLDKYKFIDWQFGWKPFLNDLGIISAKVTDSVDRINAKLASLRVPVVSRKTFNIPVSFSERVALYPYQSDALTFSGSMKVCYNATFAPRIPEVLAPFEIEQIRKDMEGWNMDPATIWEGMPFSWLVDWFIPIGSSLESISGANFNPYLDIKGTISFKIVGGFSWQSVNSSAVPNVDLGGGLYKHYHRQPLATSLSSNQLIVPKLRLPLPGAEKLGVLNDIFGVDTSLEASNRDARKARRIQRQLGIPITRT